MEIEEIKEWCVRNRLCNYLSEDTKTCDFYNSPIREAIIQCHKDDFKITYRIRNNSKPTIQKQLP